jgi:2-polyprenyl-6-methoxyphenol hydroxylase-like FAD-dependent oxidoreductase
MCDREPKKGWTLGNITLLGDAAHPTTPNLGQGGCMAIEGAYILATALNKVWNFSASIWIAMKNCTFQEQKW